MVAYIDPAPRPGLYRPPFKPPYTVICTVDQSGISHIDIHLFICGCGG